jgi:hypothetical protein
MATPILRLRGPDGSALRIVSRFGQAVQVAQNKRIVAKKNGLRQGWSSESLAGIMMVPHGKRPQKLRYRWLGEILSGISVVFSPDACVECANVLPWAAIRAIAQAPGVCSRNKAKRSE